MTLSLQCHLYFLRPDNVKRETHLASLLSVSKCGSKEIGNIYYTVLVHSMHTSVDTYFIIHCGLVTFTLTYITIVQCSFTISSYFRNNSI